jgi:hypothetical protein
VFTRIAILVGVLAAGRASADAGVAASIAIDVARPEGADPWFASALEELIGQELQRFHQVKPGEKLDPKICPDRQTRCLVDHYKKAGVEVVVLGRLKGPRLAWEVYPVWTGTLAFDGALQVAGVSTATLQRHVGDILRPIVQRGGLLDQRPTVSVVVPAPATGPVRVLTFGLVLIGLIVLLAWPGLLLLLLVGITQLRRRKWPASWKWSALCIAGLAVVLVATGGDHRVILEYRAPENLRAWGDRLTPIAAGMLWGTFVFVHLRWAFAPIHGLGQVRHDALWPLLRSWMELSFMRVVLLGLYAPVALLTLYGSEALQLSSRATFALALPAAGLFAGFWLLTLIDNLALYLDVHLVNGASTERNPWHGTIRRYFMGYLRRNGVELGSHLVDDTLFLPADISDVTSYGGGFARPRIVVGVGPRTVALGELPDEREAPERQVNPEEAPLGVLVPAQSDTRDRAHKVKVAADRRRAAADAPPKKSIPKPKLIGEHLTLLGWVMPQPDEDGVPLIASTQEEYEIVKGLLQEHYAAFEKGIDDDEVDDTDPTQKDFLFGALLREMGAISRGDTVLGTLVLCLSLAQRKASWPIRIVMRGVSFLYTRLLASPQAIVADSYPALHRGMHHLIQYLDMIRGGTPALTTRASVPHLINVSKEIFDRLDKEAPPSRLILRPTPRNRLLWLSRFFHAPLGARLGRRVLSALAMFTVCAVLAYGAVRAALVYHPVYVDRMQKLQEARDVGPEKER